MDIQTINWQQALPIRHQVLWPEQPESFCKVEGDDTANHYGCFIAGKLVCVASIYYAGQVARLRKFATLPSFQGRGIGSAVLKHALADIEKTDTNLFWCDARLAAKSLYEKFGMKPEGSVFYKAEIEYVKMSVVL